MSDKTKRLIKVICLYAIGCFIFGALLFISYLFTWSSLALFVAPVLFGIALISLHFFGWDLDQAAIVALAGAACFIPGVFLWLLVFPLSSAKEAFALFFVIILPPLLFALLAGWISSSASEFKRKSGVCEK